MLDKVNILGIIPARFNSSRLEGKLLMKIGEQSVLQRVHSQVIKSKVLDRVIIATDDQRIFNHAKDFGAEVVMTGLEHKNGTNRCIEVFNTMVLAYDYMVNIQGDEPFINAVEIDLLLDLMIAKSADIGTLAYPIQSVSDFMNPNIVKVIRSKCKNALYFSRSPIPFHSSERIVKDKIEALQHIGLYAFHKDIISQLPELKNSKIEGIEQLEQLKWLDNDLKIVVGDAMSAHIGIDTDEDLERARSSI